MSLLKHFSPHTILLAILLLGLALRLIGLGSYPSGLQGDEASFLLNAKTIMLTGRDEDNRFLPVYLNSFIDPKPALYSYLQIPFIYLLGITATAARLPAMLFGVVSLYLAYLFCNYFLKRNLSLLITFLLAISPWHILLSRASQEVIMSFTFVLAALIFLMQLLRQKKGRVSSWLLLVGSCVLAMYSYHSAKVFLPLVTVILVFLELKRTEWKKAGSVVVSIVLITLIVTLLAGFTRASAVSIFSDPHTQLVLDEKIRTTAGVLPLRVVRIFVNKSVDYFLALLHNFGQYFTFDFLFLFGGQPERYIIPFQGLFLVLDSIFMLFGLFMGFTKERKRVSLLFVAWLLIAPLPGIVTSQEVPSVIRAFLLTIPLTYFLAVGILTAWQRVQRLRFANFIKAVGLVLYAANFAYFLFTFFVYQPYYHPWYRDYENGELPQVIKQYGGKYQHFSISTNQYAYFTLAGVIPVRELQQSYPRRLQKTDTFGKLTFHRDDCVLTPREDTLSAVKASCTLDESVSGKGKYMQVGTVPFKDGATAYKLYAYHQPSLAAQ